jgi:hypothetical protein
VNRHDHNFFLRRYTRTRLNAVYVILSGLFAATVPLWAQTWRQTSANTNYYWYGVASSADGTKLAATVSQPPGVGIYLSTNYGLIWTPTTTPSGPAGGWGPIVCSADGTKLAAANGYIYISTNSGAAWNQSGSPNEEWTCLASSADGSKLIAAQDPGYLNISTNFGSNWFIGTNLEKTWSSVVCSADGSKMAAQYNGDDAVPWVSTNGGLTWQPAAAVINQGGGLAASATGNILMMISRGDLFRSTNWGLGWSAPVETPGYGTIVCSADGSTALSYDIEGISPGIHSSTDFGANWASNELPLESWTALATSSDGKELVAAAGPNGGIWISQTTPTPQLNISFSSNNLNFSWIAPSTNMALAQSPDLMNWMVLTNSPRLNYTNLQEQLTLSPTNSIGFYRLVSQ